MCRRSLDRACVCAFGAHFLRSPRICFGFFWPVNGIVSALLIYTNASVRAPSIVLHSAWNARNRIAAGLN